MNQPRYNAGQEAHIDHKTTLDWHWSWRLLIKLFPGAFTIFVMHVVDHAYERGMIGSYAYHEMPEIARRMSQPKRTALNVPRGHQPSAA